MSRSSRLFSGRTDHVGDDGKWEFFFISCDGTRLNAIAPGLIE
jgi:hypothetical protein